MDGAACQPRGYSPCWPPCSTDAVCSNTVLASPLRRLPQTPKVPEADVRLAACLFTPRSCMQLLQMHNECQAACETFQYNVAR